MFKFTTLVCVVIVVLFQLSSSSSSSSSNNNHHHFVTASASSEVTSEPINPKQFSLYDYIAGLWQVNVVRDNTGGSAAGRLIAAFSPDFTGVCQIEGRPGFPSENKVYGLPADVELGTGKSNVIACHLTVHPGKMGETVARFSSSSSTTTKKESEEQETEKVDASNIKADDAEDTNNNNNNNNDKFRTDGLDTIIYILPQSINGAIIYRTTPFSVLSKKDQILYEKHYSISSKNNNKESSMIVTHTASLNFRHLNPAEIAASVMAETVREESNNNNDFAQEAAEESIFTKFSNVISNPQSLFATSSPTSGLNKKLSVAVASANFVSVVPTSSSSNKKESESDDKKQQQQQENKEADEDENVSSSCSVELTRFSAILTTKADILANVALSYTSSLKNENNDNNNNQDIKNCVSSPYYFSSSKFADNATNTTTDNSSTETQEVEEKETEKEKDEKEKEKTQKEHVLLFNLKHFATIDDEDIALAPDTPFWKKQKYGPIIGAFVLLFVLVGGRKALAYFLRKRGMDPNQFLKSTRQRTKEEIMKLRAERDKMKTGPTTDEEVAKLQAEEQRRDAAATSG